MPITTDYTARHGDFITVAGTLTVTLPYAGPGTQGRTVHICVLSGTITVTGAQQVQGATSDVITEYGHYTYTSMDSEWHRAPMGAGGGEGTPATTVSSETSYGISPAVGASTNYAREDHTHGSPTAPVIPSASGSVVSETSYGQAASAGAAATFSRGDHTHGTPAALTPASSVVTETSFGQASAVGSSANYARQDHTHGTPTAPTVPGPATTVTSETTAGLSPAVGVATTYAREDHTHGTPAAGAVSMTQATVTLPYALSTHRVSVTDAGVSPTSKILLSLAGVAETSANSSDAVELLAMQALPGSGSFTLSASFLTPVGGPLTVNYVVA